MSTLDASPQATVVDVREPTLVSEIPLPPAPPWSGRATLTRAVLRSAIRRFRGPLRVILPDGGVLCSPDAGSDAPTMVIASEDFFARCAQDGKVGFGEAYMARDWEADDLAAVLTVWADNLGRLPVWFQRLSHLSPGGRQRPAEANTRDGSSRNIRAHYDLSNELFATFLDRSLTYSCAVFEEGDTLADAQARKRDLLLDELGLGPEDHLLEVGTGWGALAVHAAKRHGCRVTTVTLSHEQAAFARDLVERAGVADLVEVRICDYRDVQGRYDAVVSVEMFEAVGERFWGTFFGKLDELLLPGGRIALQTITMRHDRFRVARGGYGWIHKYVFPGGEIPSLEALAAPLAGAGLQVTRTREIGPDYVETLRQWRELFLDHEEEVHDLGFGHVFVRLWEFYLAYSQAGFASGTLGNVQMTLARHGGGDR